MRSTLRPRKSGSSASSQRLSNSAQFTSKKSSLEEVFPEQEGAHKAHSGGRAHSLRELLQDWIFVQLFEEHLAHLLVTLRIKQRPVGREGALHLALTVFFPTAKTLKQLLPIPRASCHHTRSVHLGHFFF